MVLKNKLTFAVLALCLGASALWPELAATPKTAEQIRLEEKVDWWRSLQKNINAASWLVGVYAVYDLFYNLSLPVASSALKKLKGELSPEEFKELCAKIKKQLRESLRFAGLACAIEVFNKLFPRSKYYGHKTQLKELLKELDAN